MITYQLSLQAIMNMLDRVENLVEIYIPILNLVDFSSIIYY